MAFFNTFPQHTKKFNTKGKMISVMQKTPLKSNKEIADKNNTVKF